MWIRETEWPTVTPLPIAHSSGQKTVLPSVLDLAILNSYILNSSCEGKKISHRFLIYPHEEYVGTCWTRKDNMKEIK